MNDGELSLERWSNFYTITSTAAATLMGLLFVVITVGAERRPHDAPKIRLYLTPIVVCFGSVLCIAVLLALPNHTPVTAAVCVGFEGVIGLVYCAWLAIRRSPGSGPYESPSDVVLYAVIPCAGHALVIAGGALLLLRPRLGLDLVAAGAFLLLALAIRNSWSLAIAVVAGSGS